MSKFAIISRKRVSHTGKVIPREVIELEPLVACIPSAVNKNITTVFKPSKKIYHKSYNELLMEKANLCTSL